MTAKERNEIIKYANSLTDEQLEKEYYKSVFDCLGSECEEMYERCYDMQDIIERDRHEKWLLKYSNILEECCIERGIKIWEEKK